MAGPSQIRDKLMNYYKNSDSMNSIQYNLNNGYYTSTLEIEKSPRDK